MARSKYLGITLVAMIMAVSFQEGIFRIIVKAMEFEFNENEFSQILGSIINNYS